MMRYNVAICDDNDLDKQYVLAMVERWAKETGRVVAVDSFSSAEGFRH